MVIGPTRFRDFHHDRAGISGRTLVQEVNIMILFNNLAEARDIVQETPSPQTETPPPIGDQTSTGASRAFLLDLDLDTIDDDHK